MLRTFVSVKIIGIIDYVRNACELKIIYLITTYNTERQTQKVDYTKAERV